MTIDEFTELTGISFEMKTNYSDDTIEITAYTDDTRYSINIDDRDSIKQYTSRLILDIIYTNKNIKNLLISKGYTDINRFKFWYDNKMNRLLYAIIAIGFTIIMVKLVFLLVSIDATMLQVFGFVLINIGFKSILGQILANIIDDET